MFASRSPANARSLDICGRLLKQKWVRTPGEYADQNLVEMKGASSMFVSLDPAKLVPRPPKLRPGVPAIGFGNPAEAPPSSSPRERRAGTPIDAGAYQQGPGWK